MRLQLFHDFETCSAANLAELGPWLYVRDPTTDIRCVSFCLVTDGVHGEIKTWWRGDPVPEEVRAVDADPTAETIAFNDSFDRQVWDQIAALRYGWPIIPLMRRRCAQAA
jgi:hypothetical protein